MKIGTRYAAALAAPILLWGATAFGQTATPPASPAGTPQTVEGQVVKIDRSQGRVTIRTASGTIHEFTASAETLQDLKEGDRIEARLRR